MLVSSYIDSVISGELEQFKEEHSEIFLKDGSLKADYRQADEVIEQIKQDKMFWKYVSGKHQKIMTGKITGVPIKIKIDSFFKDKLIVDLKAMSNLDLIWDDKDKIKKNFIDFYRLYITSIIISRNS